MRRRSRWGQNNEIPQYLLKNLHSRTLINKSASQFAWKRNLDSGFFPIVWQYFSSSHFWRNTQNLPLAAGYIQAQLGADSPEVELKLKYTQS